MQFVCILFRLGDCPLSRYYLHVGVLGNLRLCIAASLSLLMLEQCVTIMRKEHDGNKFYA